MEAGGIYFRKCSELSDILFYEYAVSGIIRAVAVKTCSEDRVRRW